MLSRYMVVSGSVLCVLVNGQSCYARSTIGDIIVRPRPLRGEDWRCSRSIRAEPPHGFTYVDVKFTVHGIHHARRIRFDIRADHTMYADTTIKTNLRSGSKVRFVTLDRGGFPIRPGLVATVPAPKIYFGNIKNAQQPFRIKVEAAKRRLTEAERTPGNPWPVPAPVPPPPPDTTDPFTLPPSQTISFTTDHWPHTHIFVVLCRDSRPSAHRHFGRIFSVTMDEETSVGVPYRYEAWYQREGNPDDPRDPPEFNHAWNHVPNYGGLREESVP